MTSINYSPLGLTTEPISQPTDHGGPKATIGQFHQEVIIGYQIEDCLEVKIYDVNLFSLVQVIGHLVLEGNEIGQARPTHNKPVLAIPQDVGNGQSIKASVINFSKIFPRIEVRLMGR